MLQENCKQELQDDDQIILRKYNLADLLDNLDVYLYGHHKITANDNNPPFFFKLFVYFYCLM